MQKPIRPKKPKDSDIAPQKIVEVTKLLVSDGDKFYLIDEISHPEIFTVNGKINDDLEFNSEVLEYRYLSYNFEFLKFSDYEKIKSDCNINSDFEVIQDRNEDGYYERSLVCYKAADPNYKDKIIKFNNRFDYYNVQLTKFENDLKLYNEHKMAQKRLKLENQIKELNK